MIKYESKYQNHKKKTLWLNASLNLEPRSIPILKKPRTPITKFDLVRVFMTSFATKWNNAFALIYTVITGTECSSNCDRSNYFDVPFSYLKFIVI